MISNGFFEKARVGDRVIMDDPDEPWIVCSVDLTEGQPRDGWVKVYSTGWGESASIEPSCTRDGIEVTNGWGDGWAIHLEDEQIDGHNVWLLKRRGSDLPEDTE